MKRILLIVAVLAFAFASGCTLKGFDLKVKELDTDEKVKDVNVAPLQPTN